MLLFRLMSKEENVTGRRVDAHNGEQAGRVSVNLTPFEKLRKFLRPYRCCFMMLLFCWTFLSLLPFVKYEGDISKIGKQRTHSKNQTKITDAAQYCKYRLEQLMQQYQEGVPQQYHFKPRLLSDNPKGLQAKFLSQYFKIVPFVEGKAGLSALKSSEVFWFENRRLPLNTSAPCSLLFQNSVEGYHQLHLKHELARLSRDQPWSPLTYILDDRQSCIDLFDKLTDIDDIDKLPRFVVKNEGKGKI